MSYREISIGSRDTGSKGDVKKAQELLNSTGQFNLVVDGIFGVKTRDAVKTYQKANNLTVDGIVGKQTWTSLLGNSKPATTQSTASKTTQSSTAKAPQSSTVKAPQSGTAAHPVPGNQTVTTTQSNKTPVVSQPADIDGYSAERSELDAAYKAYVSRMESIYDAWSNREPFSYDVQTDPVYQQYKDIYAHQGQLAMLDTMGQAAALTGGYGSTYAQTAGQQEFQNYMQQLSAAVPELYGAAYNRYSTEGDRLLQEYTLVKGMADSTYAKQNDLYNRQKDSYSIQNDNYNKLTALLPMGYSPTDDELTAAGMTRPQANAISNYYAAQNAPLNDTSVVYKSSTGTESVNSGLSNQKVRQLQSWLNQYGAGLAVDGVYGSQTSGSVKKLFGDGCTPQSAYELLADITGVQTREQAQKFLMKKGISYYLPTQKEWLDNKKEGKETGSYKAYLQDMLLYLIL